MSGDVLHLVTAPQREAQRADEYNNAIHADSIATLERAIAHAQSQGCRFTAVAVAFVLDDGAYGTLIQQRRLNTGLLIAAVTDAQHRLLHAQDTEIEEPLS